MTWTYVPGSGDNRGLVRFLVTDTDTDNPIFQDEELDALLNFQGQDILLSAAQALDVIASNQVLILKVGKSLDIQMDGSKVADAIRAHANELRRQVYEAPDFEIAEMVTDDWTLRERLWKQVLRLYPD